jgi:adenosylcobinamide kinase/adenosylcobinamide-phosphate guanylyltransferase
VTSAEAPPAFAARRVLVLGGARSGKSRFALELAAGCGLAPAFIATAQPRDAELAARIERHREERPAGWRTIEAPTALAEAIVAESAADTIVLVDCLTLWLSNVMLAGDDPDRACAGLCAGLDAARGPIVLVTNEVGQGIVPATPLGRSFRDAQGRLNQHVARRCEAVVLVAAGCPLLVKPAPSPSIALR